MTKLQSWLAVWTTQNTRNNTQTDSQLTCVPCSFVTMRRPTGPKQFSGIQFTVEICRPKIVAKAPITLARRRDNETRDNETKIQSRVKSNMLVSGRVFTLESRCLVVSGLSRDRNLWFDRHLSCIFGLATAQ